MAYVTLPHPPYSLLYAIDLSRKDKKLTVKALHEL